MKKIFLFLTLALSLVLTGCSNDQDYIDAVKSIVVEDVLYSNTTEELAANAIGIATNQKVDVSQLTWKVDGKTRDGKVIVADYNNNRVYFTTVKNGDYIEYTYADIYIITAENKKLTLNELYYTDVVNSFTNLFNQ
ncbi:MULTISPECIES: membrane lipoprotein lipid attachment site-containing protein [Fusobacterium]|uniref:membrane lipoprotein lipid attachment site-containing protein n=1 Tax=Fusobacterium TaxID=848 RepID=UPI001F2FF03C|nr:MULTISPECIES: membrane lipoprotein lipid attachment site-containing protein [Fusobacterium]MCF2613294.1 membrane lipoprotein lipid attachment site-containing protein [Fusobacterium perfoetens]MDY2980329.1 membrane lipoprotein lipid attachment site-containing protein [Fusobacterium sp.]